MTGPVDTIVTVRGRASRCRVAGDGPLVVLLHGIGRTLADFAELHDRLARDHRVVSLDLAGHGGSAPLDEPHTLPALARAAADCLDALGVAGPAHLVGNSLGGAVAMRLAVDDPARAASLVLVDSAGFGREVTVALRLLALRPLGRLLLRPSRAVARRTERALFHDRRYVTETRLAEAMAAARRPHAARVMLELVDSLGTFRGVAGPWREELLDAVARLDLPILVVWGERDLILPAAHLDAARTRLPRARTHLFADTGHLPQVERAEEFHRLVTGFWAGHAADR
ncbi:alpha/beta fold hydrolase [Micromonospora sp. ATCC 39149]|uniref:Alpha/beta fold hydrolase n=1 Tax=Micromonospora carbonacea TaxID=47853 RepID=A0A7D6CFF0_9ACTN|nr:alpha/beta fold hydrolase [Micromonospora sp. ATCC 39149]QLJ96311.1 alpha/beta fold hydrolase [Micromonospora carbonacea]